MAEDLGEEDIVGLVLGFELVATDGAVGAAEVAWFQGRSREPKAAETYLGSCGPVVVLTAFGEGKLLMVRRVTMSIWMWGRLAAEWSGFVNLQRH